jgi:transposase-like protein
MYHFDIYHGKWFEKAVATQLEFLHQHIGVRNMIIVCPSCGAKNRVAEEKLNAILNVANAIPH